MIKEHPFRFGVQASKARSAKDWRAHARRIEELGYSTMFMPDHFVDQPLAPLPALAIAAEAAPDLRVGALVFDNDYKHPAILAKEIATLDLLTDGRVEFSLGAGWMRTDYDALGLTYDPPGVRVSRLEEALQIVRRCWGEEKFSFEGEYYKITDYDCLPKPVQRFGPPIIVGGGGPRVLNLAGRLADIVGINPNLKSGVADAGAMLDSTWERTAEKVAWVREGAGSRIDEIELQFYAYLVVITDDRAAFGKSIGDMVGLSAEEVLGSTIALAGTVDEIVEDLLLRREKLGFSYVVINEDGMEDFAPVVKRLAGD